MHLINTKKIQGPFPVWRPCPSSLPTSFPKKRWVRLAGNILCSHSGNWPLRKGKKNIIQSGKAAKHFPHSQGDLTCVQTGHKTAKKYPNICLFAVVLSLSAFNARQIRRINNFSHYWGFYVDGCLTILRNFLNSFWAVKEAGGSEATQLKQRVGVAWGGGGRTTQKGEPRPLFPRL